MHGSNSVTSAKPGNEYAAILPCSQRGSGGSPSVPTRQSWGNSSEAARPRAYPHSHPIHSQPPPSNYSSSSTGSPRPRRPAPLPPQPTYPAPNPSQAVVSTSPSASAEINSPGNRTSSDSLRPKLFQRLSQRSRNSAYESEASSSRAPQNGKRVHFFDPAPSKEFREVVIKANSTLFSTDFDQNYANALETSNPHLSKEEITEIIGRIEQFASNPNEDKLDLSRLGLLKLPEDKYLASLLSTKCATLDLSGNQLLSELPACIHSSQTLRELKINQTSIDFKKEVNRKEVKRGGSKLFSTLESLEAGGTPNKKTDYTKFTALKHLKIDGLTGIRKIHVPSSIETLDTSHCQNLSNIKGLQKASNLQDLTLRGCKNLKGLDKKSFRATTSLKQIDVSYTALRDIPDLSFQATLKSVSVRGTDIPDGRLSSLKNTPVEVLDLSDNKKRKNFPDWIFFLKSLESLDYSKTSITNISDELKKLRRLENLNLNRARLKSLPPCIEAGFNAEVESDDAANPLKYYVTDGGEERHLNIQFSETPVEKRLLHLQRKKSPTLEDINKSLHERPSWFRRIFKSY